MFLLGLNFGVPENSVQDSPDLNRVWEHLLLHNFILAPISDYETTLTQPNTIDQHYVHLNELNKIMLNMLNVHHLFLHVYPYIS